MLMTQQLFLHWKHELGIHRCWWESCTGTAPKCVWNGKESLPSQTTIPNQNKDWLAPLSEVKKVIRCPCNNGMKIKRRWSSQYGRHCSSNTPSTKKWHLEWSLQNNEVEKEGGDNNTCIRSAHNNGTKIKRFTSQSHVISYGWNSEMVQQFRTHHIPDPCTARY